MKCEEITIGFMIVKQMDFNQWVWRCYHEIPYRYDFMPYIFICLYGELHHGNSKTI